MNRPIAISLCVLAAACGGDRPDGDETATPAPPPAPAAAQVPDTTDAALWAYLQQQDYASWPKFPGKDERYPGTEPHGALLTTYVNELAHDALTSGAVTLPPGALLVKENYTPDGALAAITVMHKVQGYDADHSDWFWAKYDPAGAAEAAGRVASCAECHGSHADRDYIMTALPGG